MRRIASFLLSVCVGLAMFLFAFSSMNTTHLGTLPEPIVKTVDIHFESPSVWTAPGGDLPLNGSVRVISNIALEGKQAWTKHGVVLDKGNVGDRDSVQLASPSVLYVGSEYKMWYAGSDGTMSWWIMYAVSSDGISWTKRGVVLSPSSGGERVQVHHPFVMLDGGTYKMWYSGYDGSNYRIFYATSTDGLSWTRQGMVIDIGPPGSHDSMYAFAPYVIQDAGTYKMWYSGNSDHFRILYATSPDGIAWTKQGVAVDVGPPGSEEGGGVSSSFVFKEGSGYHMWYGGGNGPHARIFYAISPDGVTWTKEGKVVDVGSPGSTDGGYVRMQSIVHLPSKPYQMWYTGKGDTAQVEKIHYANMTSPPLPMDVEVEFFIDGTSPGNTIGSVVMQVGSMWSATAEINWTAGPLGNHTIYAIIDPLSKIPEMDETNNIASIDIVVSSTLKAEANGPYIGSEGSPVTLDASGSTGPANTTLLYRWDFENDGTWDTAWMTDPIYYKVYGDDFAGQVALQVAAGNDTATDTAEVTILNVPPSIWGEVRAYAAGNLTLRVAGEKWHDVTATVFMNGVEYAVASIVRMPGSPDEQAVTICNVTFDLTDNDTWSARIVYTPLDDPVNGQMWGANPAWLIFGSEHGDESRIHHTFNVRHNETWVWTVTDLRALLLGMPVDFRATATDPGSDDLTFTWDSGDGRTVTTITYNNGMSPDLYPSIEVNPITATSDVKLFYSKVGTYKVTLTVIDDDGGSMKTMMDITIG